MGLFISDGKDKAFFVTDKGKGRKKTFSACF